MTLDLDKLVEQARTLNLDIGIKEQAIAQLPGLKRRMLEVDRVIRDGLNDGGKIADPIVAYCFANLLHGPDIFEEMGRMPGEEKDFKYASPLAMVPRVENFLDIVESFKGDKMACYSETVRYEEFGYGLLKKGVIAGRPVFSNKHEMHIPLEGEDRFFVYPELVGAAGNKTLSQVMKSDGVVYSAEVHMKGQGIRDTSSVCLYIGANPVDGAVGNYKARIGSAKAIRELSRHRPSPLGTMPRG
jgi:hypothetical protein